MKDDDLYHYYLEKEKNEETSQEYLTRITYIRNFDTPKKLKTDEIDVLRSNVEDALERTKDSRVGSIGTSCEEK